MAPWPFTSIPTPPIEKIKPQNQESRVKGQIFPTWAVSEAKQILATHLAPLGPLCPDLEDGSCSLLEEAPLGVITITEEASLGVNTGFLNHQ